MLLEVTDTVQFKPGFHAKSGSQLLAQVDGTNPNQRFASSDYKPCGRIEKSANNSYSVTSPIRSSINWHLKGMNVDLWQSGETFTMPDNIEKGQYSLSAETSECRIPSIVIEAYGQVKPETEIDPMITKTKSESSLKIVPNPASESIRLVTSKEIEAVEITSAMGQSILSLTSNEKPLYEIDVRSFSAGIYHISITYKNSDVILESFVVSK